MADEICGVRLRRENVHWEGSELHVGHEWIEFVDPSGATTFSAGFWPVGKNIWWTDGQVMTPDPHGGDTSSNVHTEEIFRPNMQTAGGTNLPKCADASCDDIRKCIKDAVDQSQKNPPGYRLLTNNCRDWAEEMIRKCCLNAIDLDNWTGGAVGI